MKKTLLATAIAGALGASAAAQAATVYNQDGTQLDIYGDVSYGWTAVDTGDETTDEIEDIGSDLGFTGQHVINAGLTGYFNIKFDVNSLDEAGSDDEAFSRDESFIGLKGNFGDVRLGSWDRLLDDWIEDPVTNNERFDLTDARGDANAAAGDEEDDGQGNKLQYLSPSFNGLQFAVGTQYEGDAEDEATPVDDGSSSASFYGGVNYEFGAFSVAAVYDDLGNYDVDGDNDVESYDAGDVYGVSGQYTIDALRIALKYERFEAEEDDVADVNYYGVGARYGYGFGDVYGAYQYVDIGGSDLVDTAGDDATIGDNDDSRNEIVLGATYNISSSLYTYAEAAWRDQEDDVGDGVSVGAVYAF